MTSRVPEIIQFLVFINLCIYISSVQSLSHVQLFATPWTAACQASLSITNSQSLSTLMSIESVMPSSHLILFHTLLLPPSIFPTIRVFSNESVLITLPKYWSFSFNISPSSEHSGLISFRTDRYICTRHSQKQEIWPKGTSLVIQWLRLCSASAGFHPWSGNLDPTCCIKDLVQPS